MSRDEIANLLIYFIFGYLVLGDIAIKIVGIMTGDYPNVQCVREVK